MIRLLLLLVCLVGARSGFAQPNVAFFYGKELPVDELRAFDVTVVDPLSNADPNTFNTKRSELFAYVSVGEADANRRYVKDIASHWLIGENPAWARASSIRRSPIGPSSSSNA